MIIISELFLIGDDPVLDSQTAFEYLRASGLRLTPQRRVIIEALSCDTSHPTVESLSASLAERLPGLSLSTVYKVLHELSDLGLIRELDSVGVKRFDPDVTDHVHIACSTCGIVVDAPLPSAAHQSIAAVVSDTGSSVSRLDVVAHGTCSTCNGAGSLSD